MDICARSLEYVPTEGGQRSSVVGSTAGACCHLHDRTGSLLVTLSTPCDPDDI